jgi:hypothetical protein
LKSQFAEVGLFLDAKTYRVRAVKFINAENNFETVFSLHNVLVNVNENAVEFADDRRIEPPKLPGYKWVEHGK